jgi:DNA-binding transcriptional LysR family regulator
MKITFRQIDAFRTVVSTGTVTEAAAMLGVSQPAVSRLISDLEAEVGYPLFERSGRVLVPTPEARLLVDEVRRTVSGMERIKETAAAIGHFGHSRLSVVATPSFASQLAPDLVGRFAAQRPEAMARLEIEGNDDTVEWMVSQNFDFGFTTSVPANPSFDHLLIREDNVYCVVPPGHPLAARTHVRAQDLAGESFVSYMPASQFRFELDGFFREHGVTRQMRYETRTTDSICRLVARRLGVSVVSASRGYLATMPDCVALPFAAPLKFRAVLLWSRNRPISAVAQTFLDIARASVTPR